MRFGQEGLELTGIGKCCLENFPKVYYTEIKRNVKNEV